MLVAVHGQEGELLAADAGGEVEAALDGAHLTRHAFERGVARGVAQLVVHALEAVEVADDQAERLVGAPGALQLDVEGLLEAAPVEQIGERVAAGHVREAGDGPVRGALQSEKRRGRAKHG